MRKQHFAGREHRAHRGDANARLAQAVRQVRERRRHPLQEARAKPNERAADRWGARRGDPRGVHQPSAERALRVEVALRDPARDEVVAPHLGEAIPKFVPGPAPVTPIIADLQHPGAAVEREAERLAGAAAGRVPARGEVRGVAREERCARGADVVFPKNRESRQVLDRAHIGEAGGAVALCW